MENSSKTRFKAYGSNKSRTMDFFKIDKSKSVQYNVLRICNGMSNKKSNEINHLCYLNEIIKLFDAYSITELGLTVESLLSCLSLPLVHEQSHVRAGALKAIRHLIRDQNDIHLFNELQLPYLLCRSLDIVIRNDEERMQALKLIRKFLIVGPNHLSPIIVKCLVSLAEGGKEDRALRSVLAILCEVAVLNSSLLIDCGGIKVITQNVLETHSPKIAESLCGVLLHILEWPHTRSMADIKLDCFAAPYCDFTYNLGVTTKTKDTRDVRFNCSRIALLSLMKSWAGLIEFCNPNNLSGFKAIINILYLKDSGIRTAILDLLFEIVNLQVSAHVTDYPTALHVLDPCEFQDSWRLTDGFIAMEGICVLPSLASNTPNLTEMHLAILLYCLLNGLGLMEALIEVIVSSELNLSIRTTVLFGKLLQLSNVLLPNEINRCDQFLSLIFMKAAEGNYQANAAFSALEGFVKLLKNRPSTSSLYLDQIIQSGAKSQLASLNTPDVFGSLKDDKRSNTLKGFHPDINFSKDQNILLKNICFNYGFQKNRNLLLFDNGKDLERLIRYSCVLTHMDTDWDWELILLLLRCDLIKMDENTIKFIKTLVNYFKPSNNRFSHEDLPSNRRLSVSTLVALELIDKLLKSQELDSIRLLTDFFTDVSNQLLSITTSRSVHDCLFSPQHMTSTMCQQYFLFIGRMTKTENGLNILTNTGIFKQILNLITTTNHVCYVKLILCGLLYHSKTTQKILEKTLKEAPSYAARYFATQLLIILLRAQLQNFETWGIPLIIDQIKDKDNLISSTAIEIFLEACHSPNYLEEIVNTWPYTILKESGELGTIISTKLFRVTKSLNDDRVNLRELIEEWNSFYNQKYVLLVEADLHSSLTLHNRGEEKAHMKRVSFHRTNGIPPNILPHLFGELCQTAQGMTLLKKYAKLQELCDLLNLDDCKSENVCLKIKATLWAVGHLSTSTEGINYLRQTDPNAYKNIIKFATTSDIYSLRATAFFVLGLVASTEAGTDVLADLNWVSVKHGRNTFWPINSKKESEIQQILERKLCLVSHQYPFSCEDQFSFISKKDLDSENQSLSQSYLLTNSTSTNDTPEIKGLSRFNNLNMHDQVEINWTSSRQALGASYIGICLPKNLNDFFTSLNNCENQSKNTNEVTEAVLSDSGSFKDLDGSKSTASEDVIANLETKLSNKVNGFKHNTKECLLCSMKTISSGTDESRNYSEITTTANKDWNLIIKHIQKVANPVWCKQSKQKLLDLKQRHPNSFQDICLFSEVSKILGTFSFRPSARRFIQEIFYDLDFKLLHESFLTQFGVDIFKDFSQADTSNTDKRASLQIDTERKSAFLNRSSSDQEDTSLFDSFIITKEHSRSSDTCSTPMYPEISRPRFHTFVLDLSCTKNKFPIRDREADQN